MLHQVIIRASTTSGTAIGGGIGTILGVGVVVLQLPIIDVATSHGWLPTVAGHIVAGIGVSVGLVPVVPTKLVVIQLGQLFRGIVITSLPYAWLLVRTVTNSTAIPVVIIHIAAQFIIAIILAAIRFIRITNAIIIALALGAVVCFLVGPSQSEGTCSTRGLHYSFISLALEVGVVGHILV